MTAMTSMQSEGGRTAPLGPRALIAVVLAVLAVLACLTAAIADDPYVLRPQDTVHVRVVTWNPVDASLQDWSAINGDYTIGPAGNIAFPFIGETASAGKTTRQLAAVIVSGLRQSLGLTTPPNVTVDISQFSPVYIAGDVKSPGKYPYVPDLNVVKAVSLAGGLSHGPNSSNPTAEDLITLQGGYQVMQDQRLRLLVTQARIAAELANQADITLPAEVAKHPEAAGLLAAEKAVMQADEEQVSSQLDALKTQTTMLTQELSLLDEKRKATDSQIALAQKQLDSVNHLAGQGLAANDRVATATKDLNDLKLQDVDIETAVLQAQQTMAEAQKESAQITSKQLSDLTLLRQQTDAQIAELNLKLATQKQLIANAATYVEQGGTSELPVFNYTYAILRGAQQMSATQASAVEPGDVVMVTMQLGD